MTTAVLSPFLPDLGPERIATALERLEDEVRECDALYGLLIDHTGQIIAADLAVGSARDAHLRALAARLVPVFLASRELARTFRAQPVRAVLGEGEATHLFTQPILDRWLLAMAFATAEPPLPPDQLTARWLARFGPLVPVRRFTPERRTAERVIARDSVNLIFRDESADGDDPDRERQDVQGEAQRWR